MLSPRARAVTARGLAHRTLPLYDDLAECVDVTAELLTQHNVQIPVRNGRDSLNPLPD